MKDIYFPNSGSDLKELVEYIDHPLFHACWDIGHAKLEGHSYQDIVQLGDNLKALHIHDNMGKGEKDAHMLPFDGNVDWDDVARGIELADFGGVLDVEVTAWELPADKQTRLDFGGKILMRARRLMMAAELIE